MDPNATQTKPVDPNAGSTPENPEEQPPAAPSSTSTTPGHSQSRVITMPTARMTEIKKQERIKGQRAAMQAADASAKELGYSSHEDMITKLKSRKTPTASASRAAPAPTETDTEEGAQTRATSGRRETRAERELARAQEQRKAANRARAAAERREKDSQRRLEAQEAEHELSLAAVRHGVKDTEYAITLLRRKLSKLSPKELQDFDEDQYFKVELRKSAPYLYEVEVQPATTSPGSAREAPKPGVTAPAPASAQKNARDMSKQEFEKSLRDRGYQLPYLGTPS